MCLAWVCCFPAVLSSLTVSPQPLGFLRVPLDVNFARRGLLSRSLLFVAPPRNRCPVNTG